MSGTPGPVLVIGGTRATGLHAVRALRRRGVLVRVLARDPKVAAIRIGVGIDVDLIQGNLTRKETLYAAVRGASHLIFTAGVRSGRFARESVVKATEFNGVLNTIDAAHACGFTGRFVYMTSIGVRRRSLFAWCLNIWKGNTLHWRRRAEAAIRDSGLDYAVVRAAFLLNRPADQRAICVRQGDAPLTLTEAIARADVAEALVEAVFNPRASRATFEVTWDRGPRQPASWSELLSGLVPD